MSRQHAHPASKQRGTAYVLVLAITTLLIVLGISATQIARGELQRNDLEQDQANARICAQYTLDYMQKLLDGDTAWRADAQGAVWYSFLYADGVYMYYAYVDQIDNDITNDATQPFILYGLAISGEARRIYTVELIPDANGNLTRNVDSFRQVTVDDL